MPEEQPGQEGGDLPVQQQPPRQEGGLWFPPEDVQGILYISFYLSMVCIIYIQDRKLLEDFWNRPKPKKPVPVAAAKIPADAVEDEEEENWETDLLEHSYNPLEVAIRSLTL